MLKMFKIASRIELWALASVAFTMSACGVFWAGGVDEETNTVAAADPELGVSEENTNNAVQDTDPIVDSAQNSIHIAPPSGHNYIIVHDIDTCHVTPSEPTPINDKEIDNTQTFVGKLNNTNGEPIDITIMASGKSITTKTDGAGYFKLEELPLGTYQMIVSSGNSDGVAYLLTIGANADLLGPVPSSAISLVDTSDFNEPELQTFVYKDEPATGNPVPPPNPEPDPEPDPESSDSNGATDGGHSSSSQIEYMGHLDSLAGVPSNDLPHESDYGTIKHWTSIVNGSTEEDPYSDFKWYAEWTIEATFKLDSIDKQDYYCKNIFGKFESGTGIVSLAIIKGECGTEAPSFALYIAQYGQFYCKDAVISTATVEVGKTISLTGVFNGHYLMLYKDGFKIAEIYLQDYVSQNFSTAPFVFGDKEIDMTLSDVRLGEKAITSADVLYRYYQRGGVQ